MITNLDSLVTIITIGTIILIVAVLVVLFGLIFENGKYNKKEEYRLLQEEFEDNRKKNIQSQ